MVRVTCRYPGGYSGVREPGGDPRLTLDIREGETADVSPEKAAQLMRDFPGYFTTAETPAAVAASDQSAPGPRGQRARVKGDD